MTISLEAKKWLLNESKCQRQENGKIKKSLALSKSTAILNEKEIKNSILLIFDRCFLGFSTLGPTLSIISVSSMSMPVLLAFAFCFFPFNGSFSTSLHL
jgi:hypothetical protein